MRDTIDQLADKLPEGFVVKLGIEQGSAWVELYDNDTEVKLPDSTDKNLHQQLYDAFKKALKIEQADEECPKCGEPYWKCDHIDLEFENE